MSQLFLDTSKHPNQNSSQQGSSIFGIIALAIAVIAFFTPRLFLSMIMIGITIFGVLGLFRDSSKIWSIISLCIGGFIFYSEILRVSKGSEIYEVTYLVECQKCDIRYTNETGGEEKLSDQSGLDKTVKATGDTYITLNAMADRDYPSSVKVSVFANGKLIKTETSSGEHAIASVYCWPKEADGF